MKTYQEWKLDEAKLPDVGETVAFEDKLEVKVDGKKMSFEPNKEFEVISKPGMSVELKCKSGSFILSAGEYKAHGGHVV